MRMFIAFLSTGLIAYSLTGNNVSENTLTTKKELLTRHTWKYNEYFRNYNAAETYLVYKRGKAANLINLNQNRAKFNADGTVSEITENGSTITGRWSLINDETQLEVRNSEGTFTTTILLLNDKVFYWFDQKAANGTYAKMTP